MNDSAVIGHKVRSEFSPPDQVEENNSIESSVFQNGSGSDSYLVTEPGYQHFWDDEKTSLIGYIQQGRNLHIVGGLIAPPHRKEELLIQFCDFIKHNRLLAAFYSIPEEDVPLFRSYGFQVTKFGEDTKLDLRKHHWKGRHYSWLRRQVSFVKRQNILAEEIHPDSMSPKHFRKVFEKLDQMNREHLDKRVLKHDISLLEGQLDADHFFRKRLFVAYDSANRNQWQAYVICTPINGGMGWATEMYRSSKGSVRGVIPFLIAHTIDVLKDEGVEKISLCMVPAVNCSRPIQEDSRLIRHLLSIWERRLNFLFNVRGLRRFKSRFHPQFTPVYLCVSPKATLRSTYSFLRCAGVLKLSWKNLAKSLLKRS